MTMIADTFLKFSGIVLLCALYVWTCCANASKFDIFEKSLLVMSFISLIILITENLLFLLGAIIGFAIWFIALGIAVFAQKNARNVLYIISVIITLVVYKFMQIIGWNVENVDIIIAAVFLPIIYNYFFWEKEY